MKKPKKSPKLKRYYLKPDKGTGNWFFSNEIRILKRYLIKREAIADCAKFIRSHGGGSLRIMLRNGKFQEERTYPKGRDPRRSKG